MKDTMRTEPDTVLARTIADALSSIVRKNKIEIGYLRRYTVDMESEVDILKRVRVAAKKKILFLPHALHQMLRPDRMIRRTEVRDVIERGQVIEDYPTDARGHSCLLMGRGATGRAIHVVCAPKDDYLAVITAYLPGETEWSSDSSMRVRI